MPEMKDSGVKWLGLIPLDWEIKKAKYSFKERLEKGNNINLQLLSPTQKYGVIPQEMYQEITGLRCVQVGENANLNTFKTVHKNDFCISLSAYMGGFEYSEYEGVISPAYHSFYKTNDSIHEKYYKYLFKCFSFIDAINVITPNSVRVGRNTSFEAFGNLYIPIPPINIQKNIADFLEKKCSEIDSLYLDIEKQIETLEEYKESVITKAVTKGLNSKVEMKDSGIEWIGMMPKHWNKKFFKYTHNGSNVGETIDKEFWSMDKDDAVFYTAGLNPINTSYTKFPTWKYTRENDLLLSRNGTPYVYLPKTNALYTDHIIRVNIKEEFDKRFIQYVLQKSIETIVVDVVSIATWSVSLWNKQKITIPPLKEQKEISDYLDNKCEKINKIIADKKLQLETLTEYKKSLIYEYVTGKKEVPENV